MRYLVPLLLAFSLQLNAQKKTLKAIDEFIIVQSVKSHITFLAADEMRGRDTGSPELDIAANYIATQFMSAGAVPVGDSFFHPVLMERQLVPTSVQLTMPSGGGGVSAHGLLWQGKPVKLDKPVVYIGYGSNEDFDKDDVNGKIVVCQMGAEGSNIQQAVQLSAGKRKAASERGAAALVEIVSMPGPPWQVLANYFSQPRIVLQNDQVTMPHVLVQPSDQDPLKSLLASRTGTGTLLIEGPAPVAIAGRNVLAVIRGTDAKLREEYVAVTAHYDHVGVNKNAGQDSIFNGARDNAIGTTALLETARFFAKNPPKRSIVLIALTGEEKGMLGSTWYADHPVIPLRQTVFNLNCDGAGYNDTSIVTVIDLNRTTADDLLKEACTGAGLVLKGDPAPEQGLYDRSDNVSFAKKGVPAVNMSPGVKAFDEELMKYYHQPADEVGTLDFDYLAKFYRAMLRSVHLLANAAAAPQWKSGDKYESAGKALYAR